MFRSHIDRVMVNSGTPAKPFLYAGLETREYFLGPVRYCSIKVEKEMEDIITDEDRIKEPHLRPFYAKTNERLTVKILGIKIRNSERFWKHTNSKP